MEKEKILEAKDMMELETWLKENENKTINLGEFLKIFSKMTEEQRRYLIMAKMLPRDEIEEAIEYYDGHRFPIQVNQVAFIIDLSKRYSTDTNTILKRISQVRMINEHKKTQNNTKKRKK